jgi:hypothetical protein
VEIGNDNWTLLFTKRDVNAGNTDYLSILCGSCVVADPQGMSAAIDIGESSTVLLGYISTGGNKPDHTE